MNKKLKKSLLMLLVFAVMLLVPATVQAKPSENTVKKLYNQYLAKTPTYTWFRMLDINQDGVKELITSTTKKHSYDSDYYYIYAIRSNKVYYVGKVVESSAFGDNNKGVKRVYYNKTLKGIRQTSTGPYSMTAWLQKVNKYKLQERLCMSATYNRYRIFCKSVYGKEFTYYKTEAAFDRDFNTYIKKGCTRYVLYKNDAGNRAKKLGYK